VSRECYQQELDMHGMIDMRTTGHASAEWVYGWI